MASLYQPVKAQVLESIEDCLSQLSMYPNRDFQTAAFRCIDILAMFCVLTWELIVSVSNFIGHAWWAKIETFNPNSIYWFGPFISRKALKIDLDILLRELSDERPAEIKHTLIQCAIKEPLTISSGNGKVNIDQGRKESQLNKNEQKGTNGFGEINSLLKSKVNKIRIVSSKLEAKGNFPYIKGFLEKKRILKVLIPVLIIGGSFSLYRMNSPTQSNKVIEYQR